MFDFEKLDVYEKIRGLNRDLLPWIFRNQNQHAYLCDQLKRSSLSSMLNLAEGTGRMGAQDKKQFYIRARASVFESVAILQIFLDLKIMSETEYTVFYEQFESISKMILGMIRNLHSDNQ